MDAKTSQMASCIPMHSLLYAHGYLKGQWDICKHNERGMRLKDEAIQVKFIR